MEDLNIKFQYDEDEPEFHELEKKLWQALIDYAEKNGGTKNDNKRAELDSSVVEEIANAVGFADVEDYFSDYCYNSDYDTIETNVYKGYENLAVEDDNLIEGYRVITTWCDSSACTFFEEFTLSFIKRDYNQEAKDKQTWIDNQAKVFQEKFGNDFTQLAAFFYDNSDLKYEFERALEK